MEVNDCFEKHDRAVEFLLKKMNIEYDMYDPDFFPENIAFELCLVFKHVYTYLYLSSTLMDKKKLFLV